MDDLYDRVDWKRVTGCSIRAWMKCLQDRFNVLNDVHYQSDLAWIFSLLVVDPG